MCILTGLNLIGTKSNFTTLKFFFSVSFLTCWANLKQNNYFTQVYKNNETQVEKEHFQGDDQKQTDLKTN